MKTLLTWIVAIEGSLLVLGGGALLFGLEPPLREAPSARVFRPVIHRSVIGDFARYRRHALGPDGEVGELLGFLEYKVLLAYESQGTNFGREFVIEIVERDKSGGRVLRSRKMRVRPRDLNHGFLPPRIDEDDRPTAVRPVVRTIRTGLIPYYKDKTPGFLVEAVYPRDGVDKVAERYFFTEKIPVFGVARWERGRDVLVVHHVERAKTR